LLSFCLEAHLSPGALQNFHQAPGYDAELDLVVMEEKNGHLVAHCAATVDTANQVAEISPPCTHPEHRLQGLARAVMFEVLRRLRHRGVQRVYVSCDDDRLTNSLYEKVGFRDFHREHLWRKQF
jgi:predicted GNAT family acetyltransferase